MPLPSARLTSRKTTTILLGASRGRAAPARTAAAAALALAGPLGACRNVPPTLGSTASEARVNSDTLFSALAARFDNVQRAPKFEHARTRFSRHALSPSGVIRDTAVWTSVSQDGVRSLLLAGSPTPRGYTFSARPGVPLPDTPGESRHAIQLRKLGESTYEWVTSVDHAIGGVRADEVAAAFTALFGAADGKSEAQLRAEYRVAFPRTAAVLGELFTLDTLRVLQATDRSTAVAMRFRLHPGRIAKTRPNFSKYLEKYVEPARYRITLRDTRGATWLEASARDNRFTIDYRSRGGQLVPLNAPPRVMPDSLELRMDFSAKFAIFRVGISDLVGDFVKFRTADERGWHMRFRKEPDWHFPLAVNHLIRTALRRPFAGEGITLRIAVRDSAGAQSLLTRRSKAVVQEGAIVRWLGGLGNSAVSEFAGKAEAEENRYLYEVLGALRADMVAALAAAE